MRRASRIARTLLFAAIALLILATWWCIEPVHTSLSSLTSHGERFQVLDRVGQPIGLTYANRFNTLDAVPLHSMPPLLWHAFVAAEDRDFFTHHGVDWHARLGAITQNIRAQKKVRGASTITEQVVRIIHPRPRTVWSRWLEGFEAPLLEWRASKGEILEFYINQVPYAANRRGAAQAARYYFNRDLSTLTRKEMLALAVLPRAPSALDLYKNVALIDPAISRLANAMVMRGELTQKEADELLAEPLVLQPPPAPLQATHFINYIRETIPYRVSDKGVLSTTLDGHLQSSVQQLLDERLKSLARKNVHNGAVLVVDHTTGEILAWVIGGNAQTPGRDIDAVRTPRQPGSSMKPFLYGLALDAGWSPATELDDAPMEEAIGTGLHDFKNYSHTFYGTISLREALGNSLNIPALETIAFVTPTRYLNTLHALGFTSLTQPADFYRDGLALGSGEVTLFEMVQAFSTFAHRGVYRDLTPLLQSPAPRETHRVYSDGAASLIANILSDPYARRREFGSGSVLNMPVQTAVKTGTSTDYHDAWVIGFNARYTVGVWMGNLDNTAMDGITGSLGPALVMRGVFTQLGMRDIPRALYLSPTLIPKEICASRAQQVGTANCFPRTEYFMPGSEQPAAKPVIAAPRLTITRPSQGLQIAYDPRRPREAQAFEFVAENLPAGHRILWQLNDATIATTAEPRYLWTLTRGHYTLVTNELDADGTTVATDHVSFLVK